ncbi:unnamed protein product [Sympodiomycopsis kandeliae]
MTDQQRQSRPESPLSPPGIVRIDSAQYLSRDDISPQSQTLSPSAAAAIDTIRRNARRLSRQPRSTRRDYDDDDEDDQQAARGDHDQSDSKQHSQNGIRVWYDSYTTIDWIHDSIKESSRLRKIRRLRGIRGKLVNIWDGVQGWVIITITGIITALIAGAIVESEAVLFDLKDGYCSKDWKLAKRFCCPYGGDQDWDHDPLLTALSATSNVTAARKPWGWSNAALGKSDRQTGLSAFGMGNSILAGWAAPVAGSPKWEKLASSGGHLLPSSETCPGWVRWSEVLSSNKQDYWWADYAVYIVIAILWASIASILTIYLTSSELYISRKRQDFDQTKPQERQQNGTQPHHDHTNAAPTEVSPLLQRTTQTRDSSSRPSSAAIPPKLLSQIAGEHRANKANSPRKVLYFGSGSGISEIKCILSGFVIHGYLGFWTLFTKSVGLTLSVASGLSLGKEGPFVHIASCVGNIVSRFFDKYERNESKRREILSGACAAGVAVAFGAPIGGVLFSLEEVSYYFPAKVMFRTFFCAMIAAAVLRFLDPFGTGKIVLFQVSYDKDWQFREMPFFVILGIFGGLYGAIFTKLNVLWSKTVRAKTWLATHPLWEVIAVTALTVALSFLNGYTKMGGPELITDLFSECHEHESLDGLCVTSASEIRPLLTNIAWAMLIRGSLTIITFGIKLPAGIFIPSLAVGACFGRILGLTVQYFQWTQPDLPYFSWCSESQSACIVPGIYAMVGAAATLSGVTRTTVSLAVIMFELTGTLTYSIPVMISVLVARTIADALEHKGIYDLVLEFSGLPYLDAKADYTWQGVSVEDAMDTGIEYISLEQKNTVASLQRKITRLALGMGYTDGGFPIVIKDTRSPVESRANEEGLRMVGYIAAQELEHGLNSLLRQTPGLDPDETVCTFRHLPQPFGVEGEAQEARMRDSIFLSNTEAHDLSRYVDRAPITVNTFSPLELVQSYFVSLGVRYLVVIDVHGRLKGVIFKKRWLAFLSSLEE